MSCSYADGLSHYENKGVLGVEEVKQKKKPPHCPWLCLAGVYRSFATFPEFDPFCCFLSYRPATFFRPPFSSPVLISVIRLSFPAIRQRRGVATKMRPLSRLDTSSASRRCSHRRRHQHCCGHSGFSVIIICNFSLESPPYFYVFPPPLPTVPMALRHDLLCARKRHRSILLN